MSTPTADAAERWDELCEDPPAGDLLAMVFKAGDALRASLAQAEQERDAWVVLHDLVKAERDQAERERDAALADLRVVADLGTEAVEERNAFEADRDRLRTALEQIAEEHTTESQAGCEWCEAVIGPCPTVVIARAALGSTTEPEETRKRPLLGHATTRELLTEIKARGEVSHTIGEYPEEMGSMAIGAANILDGLPGSMLDYRTVGAEPEEAEK